MDLSRAVEPKLKFQAPAPKQFGPLKTKHHCNIGKTSVPLYVCGTGTQISGSGSTSLEFRVVIKEFV